MTVYFLNKHTFPDRPSLRSHPHRHLTARQIPTTATSKHVTMPGNAYRNSLQGRKVESRTIQILYLSKKNTNRHCQYSVSTCLKQREQSALSPRKNIQIKQQLARRTRGACGCEKRQRSSHAQLCYSSSVATCQQNGH